MRGGRTVATIILGTLLAGCTPEGVPAPRPTPSPAVEPVASAQAGLAARAAAAQGRVAVSAYTLTTATRPDRTVMVVRAADGSWRVDIPGGALGGAADVTVASTGDDLFQCARAPERPQPACVPVAELTPDIDPRVHHVFTDWLDVLTDRAAALAVTTADPLAGADGACYAVQPTAASLTAPVDAGVYCYQDDGTLTAADLALGTLALVSTDETAPPTIDLPGPVVDTDPLPTESPPPPSPTPTAPPNGG